jgi:hypothetical protein
MEQPTLITEKVRISFVSLERRQMFLTSCKHFCPLSQRCVCVCVFVTLLILVPKEKQAFSLKSTRDISVVRMKSDRLLTQLL